MPPIVALLTDFGTADPYLGSMKGAILSACPAATLVDLVHDLPPHDVAAGALILEAAYPSFPAATVFVAVVDPGVGSDRRGLALEADGYRFVGPDNGVFTWVLDEHPDARIRALTNTGLFRSPVSPVFHGRDVFGPVAGHLALGLGLEHVGPAVSDPVLLPVAAVRRLGEAEWEATVVHVDRFGNLTTNLRQRDLEGMAGGPLRGDIVVSLAGAILPLARTYADVGEGEACALMGSGGRLEVAVREGNAARLLGVGKGTAVRVRRAAGRE
jgi:S-adenosyl-L-methionine hydrolase (adenosine-forming)